MNQNDYIDAGLRVFGLYGADKGGHCECGNPDCKAAFKHPRLSNWQHTPQWSDDQLEVMEEMGQFNTGFGVLVSGLLVVDVDARNGGVASYDRLCALVPAVAQSGFIVATGSGGGSRHVYFSLPVAVPMVQTHKEFPGIDFKTSGFVVGAGSIHASGALYEAIKGHPDDITEAPTALIELLRKPDRHRATYDGESVDLSDEELRDMLAHINPSCGHEEWIRIGMALHHTTQGSGFALWDDWSAGGDSYPGSSELDKRWQSFGKGSSLATLGTIIHYAREGGWQESVEFVPTVTFEDDISAPTVDLLRPPGFVGELCQWINDQCLYPRESLAVASALVAVSNIAGMRYLDEQDGMSANLIAFCVAGSGTGKEAVGKAFAEIIREAGMSAALYGAFKSEQEIYRNLLRHQPAFYAVDELGIQLRKIMHGKSDYLTGVIGTVMSAYSKADSFLPITGDLKEEIRQTLNREYAAVCKALDEKPSLRMESRAKTLVRQLETIDDGIDKPFLSIIGYTTPATFDELFSFEQATNGFLSRAMIFRERETNPKRKNNFKRRPMNDGMRGAIWQLRNPGAFNSEDGGRIEFAGEKSKIPTTPEGSDLLDWAYQYFWDLAEQHKGATGLEAIPRRGYEMAAKVSLILAMPTGLRTAEHVTWAVEMAKQDVAGKLKLAHANNAEDVTDKLAAKIMGLVSSEHGETLGVIRNRCRGYEKGKVDAVVQALVNANHLCEIEVKHPVNGSSIKKYCSA